MPVQVVGDGRGNLYLVLAMVTVGRRRMVMVRGTEVERRIVMKKEVRGRLGQGEEEGRMNELLKR